MSEDTGKLTLEESDRLELEQSAERALVIDAVVEEPAGAELLDKPVADPATVTTRLVGVLDRIDQERAEQRARVIGAVIDESGDAESPEPGSAVATYSIEVTEEERLQILARLEKDPVLRARHEESLVQARRGEFVHLAPLGELKYRLEQRKPAQKNPFSQAVTADELCERLGLNKEAMQARLAQGKSPILVCSDDAVSAPKEVVAAAEEVARDAVGTPALSCEELFPEGGEKEPSGAELIRAMQMRLDLGLQTIGGEAWPGDPLYPFVRRPKPKKP